MLPPGFFLRQRLTRQRLERIPEPNLVMTSEQQDREFNLAALRSGLAISYELVLHSVLRLAPISGRALDVGCGSAQLLLRIARHRPDIHFTGVDMSGAMLELAEKNRAQLGLENVTFQPQDMFQLDRLPAHSFDLVTSNNALHHCEDDRQALTLIDGLAGLQAEGGTVFLFDLCRMRTEELLITLLDYTAKDHGDYFYNDTYDSYGAAYSSGELAALLARSKLRNYRHVCPLFGNIIQIVYSSSHRNRRVQRESYLISREQRMDWLMLRLLLIGRL
jgi:2-polyprenyl-3-methyl-5-hydroxy-6-metoxy-1,4-benzoquinol methylase